MDTQRWSELRYLFDAAVDLPPQQWDDFLLLASGDVALRRDVAALLHVDLRLRSCEPRIDQGALSTVAMAAQLACARPDPRIGAVAGTWRILRVLGQGSGGIVYLAESTTAPARARVALKLPHPGAVAVRERFRTERDVLWRLRCAGVVRLLDADVDGEAEPSLVFECVDGRDVRRHCALHGIGPVARAVLFVQICDIVAQVHAHGVAHRDLRAQNILVARDGGITLLDFGRATWLDVPGAPEDGRGGEPSDTPASGEDARDAMVACDARALAQLLAELWQGPEATAGADRGPGVAVLDAIVARALRPGHATPAELAGELREALRAIGEEAGGASTGRQAGADDVALLQCALAKSARQSRRLFGGVEESPGSAGQSAR